MRLRDYKLYVITFTFDQEIREHLFQDETKLLGEQRVTKSVRVLSKNEGLARNWLYVEHRNGYKNAEITSIETETVDGIVLSLDY